MMSFLTSPVPILWELMDSLSALPMRYFAFFFCLTNERGDHKTNTRERTCYSESKANAHDRSQDLATVAFKGAE